jgi:Do/DeqQ family serine protease
MRTFLAIILAGILGGVVTLFLDRKMHVGDKQGSNSFIPSLARPVSYTGNRSVDSMNRIFSVGFGAAAEKSLEEVVHIRSTISARQSPNQFDPFREFFGEEGSPFGGSDRGGRGQHGQATGSGVIIRKDGYIVTNNHVVEGATELEVSLHNKRTFKAKLVGRDPSTDLALIKIEQENLPAATFANSDNVRVGDWVLAVGNPFDLASTVTAGIISAKARSIHILEDNAAIESFLQTDAAVNPGNSGGALVNLQGQLVGINTAIATPTGTYAGYAFAVPSNIVSKVVDDLLQYGKVHRAYLGVAIQDLDWTLAQDMKLNVSEGVLVQRISQNGAAAAAGIKNNDVIVKVGNRDVRSSAELLETIARHRPGDKVTLTVNRQGKESQIQVQLRNQAGELAQRQ